MHTTISCMDYRIKPSFEIGGHLTLPITFNTDSGLSFSKEEK